MPSLDDIAKLAEVLERVALVTIPERCVRVRDRNASCSRCVDACHVKALEIDGNDLSYCASTCVNCGACAAVCPTEAIVMLDPTRQVVWESCLQLEPFVVENDDQPDDTPSSTKAVALTCARMAARKELDMQKCAEVPCLAYLDTELLVGIAAEHRCDVIAIDANCSTCKYGWNDEHIDTVMDCVNDLLKTVGAQAQVMRIHEAPASLLVDEQDKKDQRGAGRRDFFSTTISEMKQTALTAAHHTIQEKLGYSEESIYDKLHVGKNNVLPQFDMPRHMQLLDALDSFEPDPATRFDSVYFANMQINPSECNSCGMCVTFCPTGSVAVSSYIDGSHSPKQLGFLACNCVNCGLCEDVCMKHALKLELSITAQELFAFEPRRIDLGTRKPKMR